MINSVYFSGRPAFKALVLFLIFASGRFLYSQDSDGDGLADIHDAIPTEPMVDWAYENVPRYIAYRLGSEEDLGRPVDVSDDEKILFPKSVSDLRSGSAIQLEKPTASHWGSDQSGPLVLDRWEAVRFSDASGRFVAGNSKWYGYRHKDGRFRGWVRGLLWDRDALSLLRQDGDGDSDTFAFDVKNDGQVLGLQRLVGPFEIEWGERFQTYQRSQQGNLQVTGVDFVSTDHHAVGGTLTDFGGFLMSIEHDTNTGGRSNLNYFGFHTVFDSPNFIGFGRFSRLERIYTGRHVAVGQNGVLFQENANRPSFRAPRFRSDYQRPSSGVDVNTKGAILASSQLWMNGRNYPLSERLMNPQWPSIDAVAINNDGLVVGTGARNMVEKESAIALLPVKIVELAPQLRNDAGHPISAVEKGITDNKSIAMVEVDPTRNRIAHREIKIRIGGGRLVAGSTVIWSMDPLFVGVGQNAPSFRGDWADAEAGHRDRFEASAAFGAYGFRRHSQAVVTTTVDANGFTAIRVNLAPVGFNKARVKIAVPRIFTEASKLADFEVPGVVVIDPGHGGSRNVDGSTSNNATSVSGVLEKAMTLAYAVSAQAELLREAEDQGVLVRVPMTRTRDVNLTGAQRAMVATTNGADVFLSIHFNSTNGRSRGSETLIRGVGNVNEDEDTGLARGILDGVLRGIRAFDPDGARDRGVKDYAWSRTLKRDIPSSWAVLSDGHYQNTRDHHPIRGTIAEIEFIDVPAVDRLLNTGGNVDGVRQAIAREMAEEVIENIRADQP